MITASVQAVIPFHDVDVLGILWHGHYAKYFELARTQLMKKAGLDWPQLKDVNIAMPVVDLKVRYKNAIKYDQNIEISASIEEFSYPELIVNYKIIDVKSREVHSLGSTRQIYFDWQKQQSIFAVPEFVKTRLEKVWEK